MPRTGRSKLVSERREGAGREIRWQKKNEDLIALGGRRSGNPRQDPNNVAKLQKKIIRSKR